MPKNNYFIKNIIFLCGCIEKFLNVTDSVDF